jgi:Na+(H+)/acetate symporter ActP
MIRFFIIVLVCFLIPFLIYLSYQKIILLTKSKKMAKPLIIPFNKLFLCGFIINFIMIIFFSNIHRNPADSIYIPAQYKNGKIIQPQIIQKEDE